MLNTDGTTAGRANKLGSELANESEADDDGAGACIESGDANAMSGDRSDSGERPETILQRIREAEAQWGRDDGAFGVAGRVRSDARDAIADTNAARPRSQRFDDAGTRIAGREQIVEPSPHGSPCGAEALSPTLLDHLADKIGPVARLAEQALRCRLRYCLFGSGCDQRPGRPDEDPASVRDGIRGLDDVQFAGAKILDELAHRPRKRYTTARWDFPSLARDGSRIG
jgi:hypothetical protein